ncbi:regulator of chromosome condensation 1/beta-lactamase-inhibitor protein II [Irpex lacteus]|nr:regulator of chromosome condensation 1/beta-lactamase-inhibitor protein II [Irpex lacteus]
MPPQILLSSGSNAQGQLATGNTEDAYSFTPCSFLDSSDGLPSGSTRVVNIACGANHTLLLLERSDLDDSSSSRIELWGSGDGSKGQLGPSVTTSTQVFKPLDLNLDALNLGLVERGYSIVHVAACWETSYVVLRSSQPEHSDVLLSMGSDDFGDLGIGGVKTPGNKAAGGVYVVDLLCQEDDALDYGGRGRVTIKSIVTGPHHVLVLLLISQENGETTERLAGWGSSRHVQLGDWKDPIKGKPIPFLSSPRPIPISESSEIHTVSAGTHHTVILHTSGRVSALGSNRKGQLTAVDELSDVADIGCTWNGTYAVVRRGTAWSVMSTGNHTKGQLGRQVHKDGLHVHAMANVHFPFSHETHELVKMACGSEHVLSLVKSVDSKSSQAEEVWGWGWNEHGNLGLGHTEDQDLPVKLWPQSDTHGQPHKVSGIWAGCGTSWILLDS